MGIAMPPCMGTALSVAACATEVPYVKATTAAAFKKSIDSCIKDLSISILKGFNGYGSGVPARGSWYAFRAIRALQRHRQPGIS
jgi:hypothetical protein